MPMLDTLFRVPMSDIRPDATITQALSSSPTTGGLNKFAFVFDLVRRETYCPFIPQEAA